MFLQANVDILGQILNVGGILSFALATGLIYLWKEYKNTKQALADLNTVVRNDAVANIKIIDTLTFTINSHTENSEKILETVSETLAMLKNQAAQKVA